LALRIMRRGLRSLGMKLTTILAHFRDPLLLHGKLRTPNICHIQGRIFQSWPLP
jgi:hypothetical protein